MQLIPMANSEVLVDVRNLDVTFRTDGGLVPAVDGASFSLKRGRVLAVVGESGCGKSVIANSLLGLLPQSNCLIKGQILVHRPGEPPLDVLGLREGSPELNRLRGKMASMIFQEALSALSPLHTIGDQICEAILVHRRLKRTQAEHIAIDTLTQVGIHRPAACMKQYPHELSGGMRQRAVIAMALACKPLLLIADEPTTALDGSSQAQVFDLIRQMQDMYQTAVFLTTHDLNVVAQVADEVIVMYCGRIVERGPAHNLMNTPRHPYTIGLLASQPGFASREKGKRLFFIPGAVPLLTALPAGCHFHPRCQYAQPGKCDQGARPVLSDVALHHKVACTRVLELRHG